MHYLSRLLFTNNERTAIIVRTRHILFALTIVVFVNLNLCKSPCSLFPSRPFAASRPLTLPLCSFLGQLGREHIALTFRREIFRLFRVPIAVSLFLCPLIFLSKALISVSFGVEAPPTRFQSSLSHIFLISSTHLLCDLLCTHFHSSTSSIHVFFLLTYFVFYLSTLYRAYSVSYVFELLHPYVITGKTYWSMIFSSLYYRSMIFDLDTD